MTGGGSQQTEAKTVVNELPQWVQDEGKQNYATAQGIADKYSDYNPLFNQQVAGTSPDTQAAYDLWKGQVGSSQPSLTAAGNTFTGLMGYQPGQVTPTGVQAGQVAGADLSPYLNPFTQNVIDTSMGALDKQRVTALQGNAANAAAAHSFGGARQGVVDGVTNAETADKAGQLAANLNLANYNNATGLLTGDINRQLGADQFNAGQNLSAQTSNQSAGLQGAQLQGTAASNLINTEAAQKQATTQDFMGLNQIGAAEQAQTQAGLDAQTANAKAPYEFDQNKLNMLLATLGMTPYNTTQQSNGTISKSSSPDWATFGLGAAKLGMSFLPFSDRRLKSHISPIGTASNGLPLYSFQYIWGGPTVTGHMADEVEAMYPNAVYEINGYKAVDYAAI